VSDIAGKIMVNSRNKGYRNEHELEQLLLSKGINAKRIPLSGQASYTGDIIITLDDRKMVGEAKAWKSRFFEYELLKHSDVVFKKTVGRTESLEWLVVLPIETFIKLLNPKTKE
jgi:hypothetical protein